MVLTQALPGADSESIKQLAELGLPQLAEVPIVSAARHAQNRFDSTRRVSVITAEEIRRRNFRTIPEALVGLAGVFLQQTNYGGGSPIIRGMVGNRILLMLNGIRLNNGTYRLGPNQYLNFIDINQVDRIEVMRGAGSVLYGSDAFGGTVNVITKSAPDARLGSELAGRVKVRLATADRSGAGRVEMSGAHGRLGLLGGYTQEGFGDLRAGGNTGLQRNTGYSQSAADASLSYAIDADKTLTAGFTRLKQNQVPRSDLLASGSDTYHQWAPEGRDLGFVQYSQTKLSKYIDAVQITLAYQHPFEYLHRISASDPLTERRSNDEVLSRNFAVQIASALGSRHVLTYGLEAAEDSVRSGRIDLARGTGIATANIGMYPDKSGFNSLSLFLQDEVQLTPRLDVVLGVRHDRFGIHGQVSHASVGELEIDGHPSAVIASAHVLYRLTKSVSVLGGLSQGFRAPNIDDSMVVGGSGGRFEVPNSALAPEQSINGEYGVRIQSRRGYTSLAVFEDHYRNLIDRVPHVLNGRTFVDSNGNGDKDAKELDVYQRQNTGRAITRGFELENSLRVAERWTWTHTTTWTYGADKVRGTPLTRIPPLNGISRVTWQPARSLWIEAEAIAASAQRRLSPGDQADIRISAGGTPGFIAFHMRAGLNRSPLAGLSLAWENLANRRYRFHGSGIDRPGSSVVVSYGRSF